MKYRTEIDGLRALAVIPVILFHAGFELFSGGFVGVDMFFVISGYLITTILINDIENKRFSILNFYERRARRILPALFVVVLVCIPFSWLWMSSSELKSFSQSLVAVSLFASNILFNLESDYFDPATEEKPLLHTWSLAVEEQYYVFFPIFLLLAWRFGKNKVFWMIVVFAGISLALSEWGWRNQQTANFYLAPFRAWELLAGSIAAFLVLKRGVQANNLLSLLGLVAIIFSIFTYDENIPFPSVYSLVPVLGVVFLILFADKDTFAAKLLSNKAFVSIGLISYSAYLWHQPLFAFVRLQSVKEPSLSLMAMLSIVTLILAYLSWRYIEKPFRGNKTISTKTLAYCVPFFFLIPISIGLYGHLKEGKLNDAMDTPPNIEYISMGEKIKLEGAVCNPIAVDSLQETKQCFFGDLNSKKKVVLLGDSHARAISYSLDEKFKANNVKGVYLFLEGCETVPYVHLYKLGKDNNCAERFDQLTQYIKELDSDVIVASRWTFRLYPIKGVIEDMPYKNSEGYVERDAKHREYNVFRNGKFAQDEENKSWALTTYIEKLAQSSNKLFLIYPVPETAINIEKLNRLHFSRTSELLPSISIPLNDYLTRNKFIIKLFDDSVKTHSNIIKIEPQKVFCDTFIPGRCVLQFDTIPFYYDDDHLSKRGADLVVNEISTHEKGK